MKAAQVDKKVEFSSDSRAVKMRDIATHEFDIHTAASGPTTRDPKRPFNCVDACRFPATLR
jgi:hypothetical protein